MMSISKFFNRRKIEEEHVQVEQTLADLFVGQWVSQVCFQQHCIYLGFGSGDSVMSFHRAEFARQFETELEIINLVGSVVEYGTFDRVTHHLTLSIRSRDITFLSLEDEVESYEAQVGSENWIY